MYSAIRLFTVLYLSARLSRSSPGDRALCVTGCHLLMTVCLGGGGGLRGSELFEKVHLKIKMAAINGKTRYISTISQKNRGLWTVYSGIHFLNNWGLVYICYHYRSWYSTSENILLYQWCLPRFFLVSRNLGVSYSSSANLSCLIPFLSF